MTEKLDSHAEKHAFTTSLPAKLTGIVFWGMVLVGVLVATYLLNEREHRLKSAYSGAESYIGYELERLYQIEHAGIHNYEYMSQQVMDMYRSVSESYPIKALSFSFAGHQYQMGHNETQEVPIRGTFSVLEDNSDISQIIPFKLYMQDLDEVIMDARKNMLLVIGVLVFSFGMILQQILQKVLSSPILAMVASARQFADGDRATRFNDKRSDELGYLAKFINQALDSILQQQNELQLSRQELIKEKIQAEVTLHSIMDGVITTNADDVILYLNPVAERLLGLDARQSMDLTLQSVIHLINEDSGEILRSPTLACLANKQVEVLENHAALMRDDGKVIPVEATAAPMRNAQGEVIGAVMVLQDVSQQRRMSRQLSYQASHDMLTGLYNRRMFEEQVEAALQNVAIEDRHHALCYVDLDQFKIVNDTCGHIAGDELLRQLGELLKSCIREGDILARLGGDEFGLLLENCAITRAAQVADKMRQSVKDYRFVWQEHTFEIGASIGVVAVHADNMEMQNIMAAADMACYAAKDMGRNRVHVYEASDAVLSERHGQMHWASRITQALDDDCFILYEQPVVNIATGEASENASHCEVLIRLKDKGNVVQPDAFIPAAERYNLMPTIDRWVISKVFQLLNVTRCTGDGKVVAINLSGTSLADETLLKFVQAEAAAYQVDMRRVCFEITETAAISNLPKATHFIKELRKQGCRFSLDDFGSGLSSFTYLKNLPVDYIKIDGSFVVDMLNEPIDRAMVEAIVSVGHIMGVQVIAEWVENQETLDLLREMGVDYAQGYHLGRPSEVNSG